MDRETFVVRVKTKNIDTDFTEDVETIFETSNSALDNHWLKKKNKKLYEKMKDELGGKTMKPFVGLRAKTYSYSKDNNDED